MTLLSGCDYGVLWEDETYTVAWIDLRENTFLYRKLDGGNLIGRAGPGRFHIGSNASFVVYSMAPDEPCSYFAIDKAADHDGADPHEVIEGPICDIRGFLADRGITGPLTFTDAG
ncbi:hypothetical protein [Vannielia litorea]|uniref:hypothetical protein n=1 Tax=Vannielia litorea TaxID=1217970 RepID=UPI001BCE2C69|nr:hypothetical protein [Vannielia litorea]MBS8227357.1 hypothetical protein [Vannielia litorea]